MVGNPIIIPGFGAEKGTVGKEIALSILPLNHRHGDGCPHYARAQCQAQLKSRQNDLERPARNINAALGDSLLHQVNPVDKKLLQLGVYQGPVSVAV